MIQKKVCMLGDFAVGKTSLVRRFVHDRFDDKYLSTIGVKVSRKALDLPGQVQVNLLVWDLAGSEKFNGAQENYLKGTAGALIVCDLTRKSTLSSMVGYLERLYEINGVVPVMLIGNKSDLESQRDITPEELEGLTGSTPAAVIGHLITSAKTGTGVEDAFTTLAEHIIHRPAAP